MEYYMADILDKLYVISGAIFGVSTVFALIFGLLAVEALSDQEQEKLQKRRFILTIIAVIFLVAFILIPSGETYLKLINK